MTKALIIGGGIAGPVTAVALQRAGIESVVYEAYRSGVCSPTAPRLIPSNAPTCIVSYTRQPRAGGSRSSTANA